MITSAYDSMPLSVYATAPDFYPTGIVQIIHDINDHKERYQDFMRYLSSLGFFCMIHDMRGHGESLRADTSPGSLDLSDAALAVEDVYQITSVLKQGYPDLPVFLIASGVGASVARSFINKYDSMIDGAILCGAFCSEKGFGLPRWLLVLASRFRSSDKHYEIFRNRICSKNNRKFKSAASRYDWLSSDQTSVREFCNDPLCDFDYTVNGYLTIGKLIENADKSSQADNHNSALQIWVISGMDDPCKGTHESFEAFLATLQSQGYKNVSGKLFKGMRHDLLHERDKQEVYAEISGRLQTWKNARYNDDYLF